MLGGSDGRHQTSHLLRQPSVQVGALSGINVILPMAGNSEDFVKAGYRFPKPLVNLVGRPMLFWLLDALKLQPVDTVFLALPRIMEGEYAIERRLRDEYPHVDFRFVLLEFSTRGAAETLFATLQHLSRQELERRTISLDCDNIYRADVLSQFRSLPPGLSATWYFDDNGDHALYSYLKLSRSTPSENNEASDGGNASGYDLVQDVREKVAISRHANIGAYGFANGALLKAHCESVIDARNYPSTSPTSRQVSNSNSPSSTSRSKPNSPLNQPLDAETQAELIAEPLMSSAAAAAEPQLGPLEAGGWYVSAVMRNMLQQGAVICGLSYRVNDDFIDLGTPARVQDFLCQLRSGDLRMQGHRRLRFVFDLDFTLVTPPKRHGDYSSVEPIEKNIALVRSLKAAGNYIIIWTARESERHRGNVGAIVAAVGKVTLDTLEQYGIPYDELLFGKPHADAYIDHRAVNSCVDTEKELGWVATAQREKVGKLAGGVAARAFNTVRPLDEVHVVKTGPCSVMRGELHWYRNIPAQLADLFPKPVEISDGKHMASIVMTRVEGVPFTHLLVNLCLTPTRLLRLLRALTRLHRCPAPNGEAICFDDAPAPTHHLRQFGKGGRHRKGRGGARCSKGYIVYTENPPRFETPEELERVAAIEAEGAQAGHQIAQAGHQIAQAGFQIAQAGNPVQEPEEELQEVEEAAERMAVQEWLGKAGHQRIPRKVLYENLRTKLVERYDKHRLLYHSFSVSELGFDVQDMVQPLLGALKRYEDNDRACCAAYIHGDPVFSNVLMGKGGGITLLDMRGALGSRLTTSGDVVYDLAKVYQSLCGYDFILEDHELTSIAQGHLESLQRVFWSYAANYYPEVSPSDVRLITAQHFFAIVPLHEVRSRMCLYLRMSHSLMLQEGLVHSEEK